jgi:hypothetical protein
MVETNSHPPAHPPGAGNRRRTGRIPCAGASCQFGPVVDLSRTGARVCAKKPLTLPPDATINLILESHGVRVLVPAHPASNRRRPDGRYDIGFDFVSPSEELSRELVNLLRVCLDTHACTRRTA